MGKGCDRNCFNHLNLKKVNQSVLLLPGKTWNHAIHYCSRGWQHCFWYVRGWGPIAIKFVYQSSFFADNYSEDSHQEIAYYFWCDFCAFVSELHQFPAVAEEVLEWAQPIRIIYVHYVFHVHIHKHLTGFLCWFVIMILY